MKIDRDWVGKNLRLYVLVGIQNWIKEMKNSNSSFNKIDVFYWTSTEEIFFLSAFSSDISKWSLSVQIFGRKTNFSGNLIFTKLSKRDSRSSFLKSWCALEYHRNIDEQMDRTLSSQRPFLWKYQFCENKNWNLTPS